MPAFTWLEPNYFDGENYPASDQHPDHDVSIGDQLIKSVYDAVRASPLWNKTALIITYDEHGGFFDHVPPPMNVPNPDGLNSTDDPFDFTRLGTLALVFLPRLYSRTLLTCELSVSYRRACSVRGGVPVDPQGLCLSRRTQHPRR
jgi:hypothetical protein